MGGGAKDTESKKNNSRENTTRTRDPTGERDRPITRYARFMKMMRRGTKTQKRTTKKTKRDSTKKKRTILAKSVGRVRTCVKHGLHATLLLLVGSVSEGERKQTRKRKNIRATNIDYAFELN